MTIPTTHDTSRRLERRNLARHFIEMVLAMMVGMVVLGMAVGAICAALGHSAFLTDHAGFRSFVMMVNMSIGMAVWMRYRGHAWAPIGEMVGAMCLPWALLIVPYVGGAISADVLLVGMHVFMFPAMIAAMYHRRDEYAHHHHRRQHAPLH